MASQEDFFGPQLPQTFDFTLLFEQSILSLLPTALLVLLAPLYIFQLSRRLPSGTESRSLLFSKLVATFTFFAIQVVLLGLWCRPSTPKTRISILAAVFGVLGAIIIIALSYLQHVKSIKPSPYLNGYLLLSSILDIAQTRTLWIRQGMTAIAIVNTTALLIKGMLLVLEEMPKRTIEGEKRTTNETSVGIINRGLFYWLNKLFLVGARNILHICNIESIDDELYSETLLARLEDKWNKDAKSSKFALMKCTFRAYKWQFAAGILPRLLFSGFTFAQPFLINLVIEYVSIPRESRSSSVTAGIISATVLLYVGLAITGTWYKHMTYRLLTMCRGGLASLVFKKTLKLDMCCVRESAPVTLMSTDIESVILSGGPIHDIWASFLELPVAIYLLYLHVGFPSLFILIPAIVSTGATALVSPALGPARVKWNKVIQERVGAASIMLSQIKAIKMMGLTSFIRNQLSDLRTEELRLSRKFRWILVQINSIGMASQSLTPVIILLTTIFLTKANHGLTVAEAFTSLSIINIAAAPMIRILVSVMTLFGAIGSFTRLQAFLLSAEHSDSRRVGSSNKEYCPQTSIGRTPSDQGHSIAQDPGSSHPMTSDRLSDGIKSSVFDKNASVITISDATFAIGDSRTEVLQDISMSIRQGSFTIIVGRVGCGKLSLLKAIAGEVPLVKGYIESNTTSVAYCDQTPWLQNISLRDNIIGESEYDEGWFRAVTKACALHEDILAFSKGDLILVGSGGAALSGGQKQRIALARAVYSRKNITLLDDIFSGLDNRTSRVVFQKLLGSNGLLRQRDSTVVLATHNLSFLSAADSVTMLESGRIVRNQAAYDSFEPSDWGILSDNSNPPSEGCQDGEDKKTHTTTNGATTGTFIQSPPGIENAGQSSRQTGDIDCYRIYLRSMGAFTLFTIAVLAILHVVLSKMISVWLKLWTEEGTSPKDFTYMGGYIGFVVGSIVLGSCCIVYYLIVAVPKSSQWLYDLLLDSTIRAPLHFFTSTDNGITLNRFSQDMTLIDSALPMAFFAVVVLMLSVIAETGIIATGASYVGAIIPVCILALYFIQRFYLRTSRQIRYLDLKMKSPLYTQFTETLAGLSTIRAFGWTDATMTENHRRLDISQRPFYYLFCIQRWLQVVLDLFVAGIALVLIALALNFPDGTSKGAIGLAMVNVVSFSQSLTELINMWTSLETSLGAISRLKYFIRDTPDENRPGEKGELPSRWPSQGGVVFENVTASYSDGTEPTLRNISLAIQPGQKVGVCGRSGSGKSSLILAIARLLELHDGSIRIDGVDLSALPRQYIRSHIMALPQDALQLTGTVRYNLDPENTVQSDELLISVLEKTCSWSFIASRGGLNATMEELGLSAGQHQLLALARALLRRDSPLILLDEATSSVDNQTDHAVRTAIANDLDGRTVIEVAHRLDIVCNYDVIVILDEGRVIEVGALDDLLVRNSVFKSLWDSRGYNEA